MEQKYAEYAAQKAVELLAIDSPTGFTDRAAAWVQDAFGALGFVGLLRTWLERDCVEKADDMAVLSDRMIRLGLTSSLQTP